MSIVFQNIDPPPPWPPGESVAHAFGAVGGHTRWVETGEGGGGSIFWKTLDTALYSTYVNTLWSYISAVGKRMLSVSVGCRWKFLLSVLSSDQSTTGAKQKPIDDLLWPASCWFSWRRVRSVLCLPRLFVKKLFYIPVPSRDVTYQTLPRRE